MINTRGLIIVVSCVLLFIIGYLYLLPTPVPPGITTEATPAKELKKVETIPIIIDFVKVYPAVVKTKLKLPTAVQQSSNQHVVASTKVKADGKPHTITTVLDTVTKEFTTYDRVDPIPWLAVSNTTHLSAYYGIKNGNETLRLMAQQELLRIKSMNLEAIVSVDIGSGKPDTFIGVGARLSF